MEYPYRWNAFVIRTHTIASWSPIYLAAEILALPGRFMCHTGTPSPAAIRVMQWTGGDLGYTPTFFIFPLPGHPHFPWGHAITTRKLPSVGPP